MTFSNYLPISPCFVILAEWIFKISMRACSLGSGISGMNEWVSSSCMRDVKRINFTTRRNRQDTGCVSRARVDPGNEVEGFRDNHEFCRRWNTRSTGAGIGFEVIFPVVELQRRQRIGWGHSPIFRSKRPGRRRAGSSVSGRFVAMMILTWEERVSESWSVESFFQRSIKMMLKFYSVYL